MSKNEKSEMFDHWQLTVAASINFPRKSFSFNFQLVCLCILQFLTFVVVLKNFANEKGTTNTKLRRFLLYTFVVIECNGFLCILLFLFVYVSPLLTFKNVLFVVVISLFVYFLRFSLSCPLCKHSQTDFVRNDSNNSFDKFEKPFVLFVVCSL